MCSLIMKTGVRRRTGKFWHKRRGLQASLSRIKETMETHGAKVIIVSVGQGQKQQNDEESGVRGTRVIEVEMI